jgi:transposase
VTSSMPAPTERRKVIIGVDTHKHVHVAVAIDVWGIRLEDRSFPADSGGYRQLIAWGGELGPIEAFGIEGTGSYGAGLTSAVRRAGHRVVEVNRGDRRARRANGKSDTLDAELAARSVLAGQSTAVPKAADGSVEMMRQLKIARDTAVKARTSAIISLKQIIVNAPAELRESLAGLPDKALIDRCAGFRPGPLDSTTASAKHTLRALARRWLNLNDEIHDHDRHLDQLTADTSPTLRDGFGIGVDTAAEMLIIFGDNPERIRCEAAFAKLCGACPIPASSGMNTGRHRLYRGGHRQANAALYRSTIVRMRFHQPTIDYVARRTAEGMPKREIIRCIKRFLAREIYQRVMIDHRARNAVVRLESPAPSIPPTLAAAV